MADSQSLECYGEIEVLPVSTPSESSKSSSCSTSQMQNRGLRRFKQNRAFLVIGIIGLIYCLALLAHPWSFRGVHRQNQVKQAINFNHGADRGKVPLKTASSDHLSVINSRRLQAIDLRAIETEVQSID